MAVHHQLIRRPPDAVWSVLRDRDRYSDWVVGTSDSRPAHGHWPEVGSALQYTVRIGPWTLNGRTVVRRCEQPRALELEAESGKLGTARIAIDVRPWGEDTLVIVDEHPLTGTGGTLHNTVFDAFLVVRHRRMLDRLADVVESSGAGDAGRSGDRSRT
ncbi:SRPBCC family protein [Streptomyces xantholiticus]|uniref:SRPBCC family protein n=1 Tax=Streptomyces xantholiticus TaxID=68285 RepID=UPI0016768757|nr:SRPBCC family protein [Streptomyces xantholiticus]GGW40377.1 polyketide cyclase [Streptomyces xantholiticus]